MEAAELDAVIPWTGRCTGSEMLEPAGRAWASATAGLIVQVFAFSAPLIAGGGAKILYDLLL